MWRIYLIHRFQFCRLTLPVKGKLESRFVMLRVEIHTSKETNINVLKTIVSVPWSSFSLCGLLWIVTNVSVVRKLNYYAHKNIFIIKKL